MGPTPLPNYDTIVSYEWWIFNVLICGEGFYLGFDTVGLQSLMKQQQGGCCMDDRGAAVWRRRRRFELVVKFHKVAIEMRKLGLTFGLTQLRDQVLETDVGVITFYCNISWTFYCENY